MKKEIDLEDLIESIDVIKNEKEIRYSLNFKENQTKEELQVIKNFISKFAKGLKEEYIIKGFWSGYRPEQRKLVHFEVTQDKEYIEALKGLNKIIYTDGTFLELYIEEVGTDSVQSEEVGATYKDLLKQCISEKTNKVENLKG